MLVFTEDMLRIFFALVGLAEGWLRVSRFPRILLSAFQDWASYLYRPLMLSNPFGLFLSSFPRSFVIIQFLTLTVFVENHVLNRLRRMDSRFSR